MKNQNIIHEHEMLSLKWSR